MLHHPRPILTNPPPAGAGGGTTATNIPTTPTSTDQINLFSSTLVSSPSKTTASASASASAAAPSTGSSNVFDRTTKSAPSLELTSSIDTSLTIMSSNSTSTNDDVVLVEHTDAKEEPNLLSEGDDDQKAQPPPDQEPEPNPEEGKPATSEAAPTTTTTTTSPPLTGGNNLPSKPKDVPQALQIVSIGTEENAYAFTFHEDQLNLIMSRIPPGWKVAVVSVLGAFRTGKSFLLSWFLRYLHTQTVMTSSSSAKSTGDNDAGTQEARWYEKLDTLGNDGFDWRGGSERNTTGIWMWSQPHFVTKPTPDGGKESMAVLLVDTQGMFDNETTMSLTASIFGLGTLLSSYQIYNVDKRIQEDNLQHLALFSEYARMAVDADQVHTVDNPKNFKPFQRIEFLVRDWQHFEDEEDYDQMAQEMQNYLDKVNVKGTNVATVERV